MSPKRPLAKLALAAAVLLALPPHRRREDRVHELELGGLRRRPQGDPLPARQRHLGPARRHLHGRPRLLGLLGRPRRLPDDLPGARADRHRRRLRLHGRRPLHRRSQGTAVARRRSAFMGCGGEAAFADRSPVAAARCSRGASTAREPKDDGEVAVETLVAGLLGFWVAESLPPSNRVTQQPSNLNLRCLLVRLSVTLRLLRTLSNLAHCLLELLLGQPFV